MELVGMNLVLFIVLIVWSGIWKGVGLWRSGRNNHLVWFVLMFVLNTAGVLPIVYLVFFSKKCEEKKGLPKIKKEVVGGKQRKTSLKKDNLTENLSLEKKRSRKKEDLTEI